MQIAFFTLFPDFFTTPLQCSILKRAQESAAVTYQVITIRDYSEHKHHITDDRPFGGGPGMVMMIEPIDRALTAWKEQLPPGVRVRIVVTSAKGRAFTQQVAGEYASFDALAVICGHYEGIDERVIEHLADEEVRIGEYVLTGGEPAALVMADAVTRLLPGVLGNALSTADESHTKPGIVGFPQYTRPAVYNGWAVPEVLLGGNHAEIDAWRQQQKNPKE